MSARQLPLELDARPRPGFENYWPGPNGLVLRTVREAAADPAGRWIAVCGPPGAGKSHLLGAAARSGGRFLACRRIREAGRPEALAELAGGRLLCIDDLDVLIGEPAWERALFSVLNARRESGAGLVFSSRTAARHLPAALPDLGSRLAWGVHLRLQPLDDGAKGRLLAERALAMGLELDGRTIDYMLRRLPRDVGALLGWLDRIAAASLSLQRRPSVRLVGELIETEKRAPGLD